MDADGFGQGGRCVNYSGMVNTAWTRLIIWCKVNFPVIPPIAINLNIGSTGRRYSPTAFIRWASLMVRVTDRNKSNHLDGIVSTSCPNHGSLYSSCRFRYANKGGPARRSIRSRVEQGYILQIRRLEMLSAVSA